MSRSHDRKTVPSGVSLGPETDAARGGGLSGGFIAHVATGRLPIGRRLTTCPTKIVAACEETIRLPLVREKTAAWQPWQALAVFSETH
jgi:hypothetical protein